MPFGVRDTPKDANNKPLEKLYACPNCTETFAADNQGKAEFKKHIKEHADKDVK